MADTLTPEEHKARHELLHKNLDELVADWRQHNPNVFPSKCTVLQLMKWSHGQTINPVLLKG